MHPSDESLSELLPAPRFSGSYTALAEGDARIECSVDSIALHNRKNSAHAALTIELGRPFSASLSRNRNFDLLYLELRQRESSGQWVRLALHARVRQPRCLAGLGELELRSTRMAESDFRIVLAFVRAAMQLQSKEDFGFPVEPLSNNDTFADMELVPGVRQRMEGRALCLDFAFGGSARVGFIAASYPATFGLFLAILPIALTIRESPYFALLLPVSLFSLYCLAAHFFNSSTLRLDHEALTRTEAPLPWPKTRIARERVQQFFSVEFSYQKSPRTKVYSVRARLSDDTKVQGQSNHEGVVFYLPTARHALIIERQLERFWKLVDVPVYGELPRDAPQRQQTGDGG